MKEEISDLTPRQLFVGLFKLAISMTLGLLLAATVLTGVLNLDGGEISSVTINALLLAFAVTIFATGIRTTLSIFDWIEIRRAKRGFDHG